MRAAINKMKKIRFKIPACYCGKHKVAKKDKIKNIILWFSPLFIVALVIPFEREKFWFYSFQIPYMLIMAVAIISIFNYIFYRWTKYPCYERYRNIHIKNVIIVNFCLVLLFSKSIAYFYRPEIYPFLSYFTIFILSGLAVYSYFFIYRKMPGEDVE